jgi:hypothetical protein
MAQQSYQVINNIKKLLQLDWIKKELEWIYCDLNKLLELFQYKNSFSIFLFLFNHSLGYAQDY